MKILANIPFIVQLFCIPILVSMGITRKTLSAIYGIHVMTVGEIVRREIWR